MFGIAEPHLELAWKCRQGFRASEACVWGRAFLPMGRWVAPVFVTPIAFGVLLILAWAWRAVATRYDEMETMILSEASPSNVPQENAS